MAAAAALRPVSSLSCLCAAVTSGAVGSAAEGLHLPCAAAALLQPPGLSWEVSHRAQQNWPHRRLAAGKVLGFLLSLLYAQ